MIDRRFRWGIREKLTLLFFAVFKYGPYYESAVVNPLSNSSVVGTSAGDANTGWAYDAATGKLKAMNSTTAGDIFDETK